MCWLENTPEGVKEMVAAPSLCWLARKQWSTCGNQPRRGWAERPATAKNEAWCGCCGCCYHTAAHASGCRSTHCVVSKQRLMTLCCISCSSITLMGNNACQLPLCNKQKARLVKSASRCGAEHGTMKGTRKTSFCKHLTLKMAPALPLQRGARARTFSQLTMAQEEHAE